MTARRQGFCVSLLGVRLAVASDAAGMLAALDRYVLPWLPRQPLNGGTTDRVVEVREAGSGAGLEVLVDGVVAATAATRPAAIALAQRALDETLIQRQRDVAVVHGGVVAHGGCALVLPGSTGTGKSTLVEALLRAGALYLSDEYALIDAAGRVHPYPRPLLLRGGSEGDRAVLATELGATVAREPMTVGLVLAVTYAPGTSLAVEAVTQGEGVLMLLRNTPQVLADQPWILAPLQRAVAGAACYSGRRGEAREAAIGILGLAARA